MAAHYEFRTVWRVTGTTDEVRDVLADGASLPRWWPAVYLAVDVLNEGDESGLGAEMAMFTKGWLPYTLQWTLRVTDPIPIPVMRSPPPATSPAPAAGPSPRMVPGS